MEISRRWAIILSAAAAFTAQMANADLNDARDALASSNGYAILVILDPTFVDNLTEISSALDTKADLRVGIGAFGGEGPEAVAARKAAVSLFTGGGFNVCANWGVETYDNSPEDIQSMFYRRFGEAFDKAGYAFLLIDNGPPTQAGYEYGQDYLVPGVGTGEDRLFAFLESNATEIRDDQTFSATDLLIDTESIGSGVWDCMKGHQ